MPEIYTGETVDFDVIDSIVNGFNDDQNSVYVNTRMILRMTKVFRELRSIRRIELCQQIPEIILLDLACDILLKKVVLKINDFNEEDISVMYAGIRAFREIATGEIDLITDVVASIVMTLSKQKNKV